MDGQEQRKITPSGHENHGVHVCSKCGWAFPNPHPSAKHRRAHKRICGKIEGHKKTHSTASDDEHVSEEDRPTPSPIIVERSQSGKGERLNRPEEEVLSSAVYEFPDIEFSRNGASPSEIAADLEVNPTDSSQMQNHALETGLSTKLVKNDVSSLKLDLVGHSDSAARPEDLVVELSNDEKGPKTNPINSEIPSAASKDVDDVMQCFTTQIGLENDAKGKACSGMESIGNGSSEVSCTLLDIGSTQSRDASESSILGHNLLDTDRKNMNTVDRISVSEKEKSNELERFVSCSDHFLEAADFVVDTTSTEVGPNQEMHVKSNDDLAVGSIIESSEDVCVLSAPDDTIVQNDPLIMLQDFKGHKSVKSNLVILDSGEAVKADNACATECSPNLEGASDHTVGNVTVERELNTSQVKAENLQSDEVEASIIATRGEIRSEESHKICSHEEESSSNTLLSPISSKVKEMTESVASKDSSDHADDQMHNTVESGRMEMATCEISTASTDKTSEFSSDSPEDKVHFSINQVGVGNAADQVMIIENLAGHASSEGATDGISKTDSTAACESANFSSEFHPVNDGRDYSLANTEETKSQNVDGVLDSSIIGGDFSNMGYTAETHTDIQGGGKDVGIFKKNEVQVEFVGAVNEFASLNQSVQVQFDPKFSESNLKNEPMLSPTAPVSFHEVGDPILAKQQPGVSAVEILTDSNSQSESLEGNCGSVSVVSIQSDAPAEALPASNDLRRPGVEEKASTRKPPTAVSKGHQHFNSDSFEPPSFMTLVESNDAPDQKDDHSKTPQNLQQPEPALKAAWFPSYTHVGNDSPGRKKNEEIMAKVTGWSTGKQRAPLKSLLGEANPEYKAKSEKPTHEGKDEASVKCRETDPDAGVEGRTFQHPLKVELAKGWNSPAGYPAAIKREKRKSKGRPYWAQFVCCSSVN